MKMLNSLQHVIDYFGFGILFSCFYCYFSGWSTTAFIIFIFVGPLLVIGFLLTLANERILSINNKFQIEEVDIRKLFKKNSKKLPLVPWLYLLCLLLPIFSYHLSYYFIERKYSIDMWWLYGNRYLSLAYVLLGVLLILGLISSVLFIKRVLIRRIKFWLRKKLQ